MKTTKVIEPPPQIEEELGTNGIPLAMKKKQLTLKQARGPCWTNEFPLKDRPLNMKIGHTHGPIQKRKLQPVTAASLIPKEVDNTNYFIKAMGEKPRKGT